MRFAPSYVLRREPAVLATALAGACGPLLVGLARQRTRVLIHEASLAGALLGMGIGVLARRRTWSADRVEDDLLDAEMAMEVAP